MSAVLEKRAMVLHPTRFHLAEHARQEWVINAEDGTSVEDILQPGYWAHCAGNMQPFDRVEVRLETGDWTADLIVVTCGRNWASMKLIAKHDLLAKETPTPITPMDHEVIYKGPQLLHCVIRKSDSAVIMDRMRTKAEALAWLENFEKTTHVG
jgi:hypothetical protein